MCEWKPDFDKLDDRVDAIEQRLSAVESATRDGLAAVNANIETLSQQMTNMDKRMVEEKVKWGETLRNCVKWVVRGLVAVAVYAAGVNISESFFAQIFGK